MKMDIIEVPGLKAHKIVITVSPEDRLAVERMSPPERAAFRELGLRKDIEATLMALQIMARACGECAQD